MSSAWWSGLSDHSLKIQSLASGGEYHRQSLVLPLVSWFGWAHIPSQPFPKAHLGSCHCCRVAYQVVANGRPQTTAAENKLPLFLCVCATPHHLQSHDCDEVGILAGSRTAGGSSITNSRDALPMSQIEGRPRCGGSCTRLHNTLMQGDESHSSE